jgi:cyclopropane fatty-acyl-phospholipid synthase-like methyltransferase
LQDAVATNWLPRGSTVLDIGCGSGEIAGWLAEEGFVVTGIDIAPAAIARAQATYQHENLRFEVLDICQNPPKPPHFDILFDRGCLHGLPSSCVASYVAALSSRLLPDGKFLLMYRTVHIKLSPSPQDAPQRVEQFVKQHFQPAFSIERVQSIDMLTGGDIHADTTLPGMAFWMVRH